MNLDTNMSRQFKLLCRDILRQRNRDCSSLPNQSMGLNTHISSFKDLRECLPTAAASFSSPPPPKKKTRETAFQVLNRTVSTNNKAFKSQMRPDPDCDRYHLLCECTSTHYSQLLWTCLDEIITLYFNSLSFEYILRIEITQCRLQCSPSLSSAVHCDKLTSSFLHRKSQDIIYRQMNLQDK